MTDAEYVLAQGGYTVSGGMWGNAAWREKGGLVFSLGQGFPGEYLNAPTELEAPTALWIYQGPFAPGWTPKLGDPPVTPDFDVPQFMRIVFPNLISAIYTASTISHYALSQDAADALEQEALKEAA